MATQDKAKIGFIGAGGFSTTRLYPNLRLVPQADLVAVCDIDREKADWSARHFGAKKVYTDIAAMLDNEELDGVFCVGSAPQQYELAPRVLERGLPVYVEKPSANTSQQARELAELAERHGTWGQVGFMKRFAHVYTMAREVMARPEFGAVSVIKNKFSQGPYEKIWGIDKANRAFLIGQICHQCDLARFLGGDIETISAFYHEATPTQFAYIASVKYRSGALGLLDWNTLESRQPFRDIEEVIEIVGFESRLTCRDMMDFQWQAPADWSAANAGTGRYLHTYQPAWPAMGSDHMFGYVGEVAHFVARCLGQVQGGPDLWDSYHALKIGEALYESAHSGQPVHLNTDAAS